MLLETILLVIFPLPFAKHFALFWVCHSILLRTADCIWLQSGSALWQTWKQWSQNYEKVYGHVYEDKAGRSTNCQGSPGRLLRGIIHLLWYSNCEVCPTRIKDASNLQYFFNVFLICPIFLFRFNSQPNYEVLTF